MSTFKILEIKQAVHENNDRRADALRDDLKKKGTFLLNLMSSPGSGKTTTLLRTIEALKGEKKIGVLEAILIRMWTPGRCPKQGPRLCRFIPGGCATLRPT
jgi:hydrogenase nickel incorporation protein HypB